MARLGEYVTVVALGVLWGGVIPLTQVATSTGLPELGTVFWQDAIMSLLLGGVILLRGEGLPMHWPALRVYLLISLAGTIIPNYAILKAAAPLSGGVMSIILAMVPLTAWPVSVLLGLERPTARRAFGVLLGAVSILMLIGPKTSLPSPDLAVFVGIAMIAPLCYAFEGNLLDFFGNAGLSAFQIMLGASICGMILTGPMAALLGDWYPIWSLQGGGMAEAALLMAAALHVFAYSGYIALVLRAGAVFASQVAYPVTGFGVIFSMVMLGERYSLWVWGACLAMVAAMALVQPRESNQPS